MREGSGAWQPRLLSPTIRARPLLPSDWPALRAAAADPLIWVLHPEPTRWQPEVFAAYFESALASRGALLVEDPVSNEVIGCSRFIGHDLAARTVEIGYTFLIRSRWGGNSNRELKQLMLGHAFTLVDSVWFVVGEANWRSRRAMEKVGGVLVPLVEGPTAARAPGRVFYRISKP